jgi:hypothetical protein
MEEKQSAELTTAGCRLRIMIGAGFAISAESSQRHMDIGHCSIKGSIGRATL